MNQCGIKCMVRLRKYTSYKGEIGKIAPNLLQRDFKSEEPNRQWATDITEFSVQGQKLYLSPIIGLFNDEIISYNILQRADFNQVLNMLDQAFCKVPDNSNLILHSDQGWQYQMKQYQYKLKKKGIRQSMSRKGNCLDNAVIENFFGHLKSELLYLQKFDSIKHLEKELDDYMKYYNCKIIKVKLNGLSPVQYRAQFIKWIINLSKILGSL